MSREHIYIAIDLKSFYASVECRERTLDPLTTNLVVADASRTEKTICLAVSPALKKFGIPGRARLFEVVQKVKEVNDERRRKAPQQTFEGASYSETELDKHPEYKLDYIAAPPRMALYMQYSTKIYQIYLRYIAPEDIHVYSIDEVFIDATHYLNTYHMTAKELAQKMIQEILAKTGITATAGIGTNLYLCKIAMDIEAKHVAPDTDGVRIAELDENSYRKKLWNHRPLTDFWRVGSGYQKKLEQLGMFTMGDIARCSLGKECDYHNEELLYETFGVNAELLIDHAWGYEPVTIDEIKAYKPDNNSVCSGQVLQYPYEFEKGKLIVREMTELLVLDLVDKRYVTDQLVLTIGYDIENLKNSNRAGRYKGEVVTDRYGRHIPKHAHGSTNLEHYSSSTEEIMSKVMQLYDKIVSPDLLIRRITITANHIIREDQIPASESFEQMELFTDYHKVEEEQEQNRKKREKERKLQEAILSVKKKYGKNAMLKGTNLQEGATTIERNRQIGGHKA